MCAGMNCPYVTYYGDCSYSKKGCYIEERDAAANVSKETRKVLAGYIKTIKTMYDDLDMYRREEELADVNGDKKDKTEWMHEAWYNLYDAAEALEKALA